MRRNFFSLRLFSIPPVHGLATALTLAFLLPGCATVSKKSCIGTDWRAQGLSDGRAGRVNRGSQIVQQCAEQGVQVSLTPYLSGYDEGIAVFCTLTNGARLGQNGTEYKDQCPPHLESAFLSGYLPAKREYDRLQREEARQKQDRELREKELDILHSAINPRATPPPKMACTFDSDCEVRHTCHFSKCDGTGAACTRDSDCSVKGTCTSKACVYH
jgi:hypothetical protein